MNDGKVINCCTCICWDDYQLKEEGDGFCRRNAPTIHNKSKYGMWPVTREDDWCGTWVMDKTKHMKKLAMFEQMAKDNRDEEVAGPNVVQIRRKKK